MSDLIPVEYLVTRYFVKYVKLNELIPFAFKGSTATHVNLYVDLYGLYKTIISRTYRTDISDYTAFTSAVINLCAHYRAWFRGINVETTIYLVSSYNIPEINQKLVKGYNWTFQEKLQNKTIMDMIELNLQLLEILCPYLPRIYFFHTDYESTVLMHYLMSTDESHDPNIILSSDSYPLQLCGIFPDTVWLKPVKYKGEDNSTITPTLQAIQEHPDLLKAFWSGIIRERNDIERSKQQEFVSPSNFALLMTLSRFPERNIKSLLHFNVAAKMINEISRTYSVPLSVIYEANPTIQHHPYTTLESRFNAIDLALQVDLFMKSPERAKIEKLDLVDPGALNMINSQYFANNPIDLFRL